MKKAIYAVAAAWPLLGGIALSGCVSVFEGTSQELSIATNPSEAFCTFERDGKSIGAVAKTPGTLVVKKSKYDITIKCNKPGYQEAAYVNHSGTSDTIAANVVIDLLLTAGISSIVDSANGADNWYEPSVNITMIPIPAGTSPAVSLAPASPTGPALTPVSAPAPAAPPAPEPVSAAK